jgi:hypothetical protein
MTFAPARDKTIPKQARPFRKAFNRLMEKMKARLFGFPTPADARVVPQTLKKVRTQTRAINLGGWAIALARIVSGDTKYMRPGTLPRSKPHGGGTSPQTHDACSLEPSSTATTQAARERARDLYMLKLFAVPTGKIAASLARRLGIKRDSEYWPRALIEIHETPLAFCFRNDVEPNRVSGGRIAPPPRPDPLKPARAPRPASPGRGASHRGDTSK